jgi:signal transduction histidine kinase
MKYVLNRMTAFFALLFAVHFAYAASDRGTPEEAVAMVKKAVEYVKANGKEKALAEFSNPKGAFVDRDLYISVYDMAGKSVAHGANARMIGKDMIELRDADGKYIVKERLAIAKEKGKGWQDFKWVNPVSKVIEPKSMYFERLDDIIIACGAYKK